MVCSEFQKKWVVWKAQFWMHQPSQPVSLGWGHIQSYKIWLKLTMSIPMLLGILTNNKFTELLCENIIFEDSVDHANTCWFKRYVQNQWQQKFKKENLTCHVSEDCTNDGCKCFQGIWKPMSKVHKPTFWAFIFNFDSLIHQNYINWLRLLQNDPDNFVRCKENSTKNNSALGRKAGQELSNGGPIQCVVSQTSDLLSGRLNEE